MTMIEYRNVNTFKDSRGKWRHVLRMPGKPKVTIMVTNSRAIPSFDLEEFKNRYDLLVKGKALPVKISSADAEGSLKRALDDYFETAGFKGTAPSTQRLYKGVMKPIIAMHGALQIADLTRPTAISVIEEVAKKSPGTANIAAAVCNNLLNRAIDLGIRNDNPFNRLGGYQIGTHHTWTDTEISQFENRWPIGKVERLVLGLLLYTGQRIGDVRNMQKSQIEYIQCTACAGSGSDEHGGKCQDCALWGSTGKIPGINLLQEFAQEKTKTELWIPMHPMLAEIIDATPNESQYIISLDGTTQASESTLSKCMRTAIEESKLKTVGKGKCVPHGLRKAAAKRLADLGADPFVIQAITGHKTLEEVLRYTKARDQKRLALRAVRLIPDKSAKRSPPMLEDMRGAA